MKSVSGFPIKSISRFSGSSISPFTRYGAAAGFASSGPPFSVSPFATGRDLGLQLHDPWRGLQRTIPSFPGVSALPPSLPGLPPPAPWTIKPDPILEQREREERERQERERERLRREREERERREREEKQRRLEQQVRAKYYLLIKLTEKLKTSVFMKIWKH